MRLPLVVLITLFGSPTSFGALPTTAIPRAFNVTTTGIATVFGYRGDKLGRGHTRCLYDERGNKRSVDPEKDVGIAHRDLDCGAVVYLTNLETGMTLQAVVVDAGPWGAISKDPTTNKSFWYVKMNRRQRPDKATCPSQQCEVGAWRGVADLTPKAAALLGHDGWAHIRLVYDKRDLRWYKRLQQAKQRQQDRRNRI